MINFSAIPWIALSIFLNTAAQIMLKVGANRLVAITFSWANLFPIIAIVLKNPFILTSISIYVLSLVTWIIVLTKVDVSIAYPFVSLAFILNAFAAYFFLGEQVTLLRIAGTLVILLGVFLVARS